MREDATCTDLITMPLTNTADLNQVTGVTGGDSKTATFAINRNPVALWDYTKGIIF